MTTLATLRTSLRSRVGNPTVAEVPNSELDARINEAVKEIADKYRFHQVRRVVTFPTVASTARYTLPTDCLVVMKLRHPLENLQLKKRDETWASERETLDDGKPTDYLRERDWIQLFPPPDDVYTLELFYKAGPATLVADGDEPVTPSSWDEGVLLLARFKYWDNRLDAVKATYAQTVWSNWIKDKPVEVDEELAADDTEGVRIPTLRPTRMTRSRFNDE